MCVVNPTTELNTFPTWNRSCTKDSKFTLKNEVIWLAKRLSAFTTGKKLFFFTKKEGKIPNGKNAGFTSGTKSALLVARTLLK